MTVGVIDLGFGNIGSLSNALYSLAIDYERFSIPNDIEKCSHLILPGVGSFDEAMEQLKKSGLDGAIKSHVYNEKPLLGICLGMQLLASIGFEGKRRNGLGLIPGEVHKLPTSGCNRVPHVGWNTVIKCKEHDIFFNVKRDVDFYFVHSYHFIPEDLDSVISYTEYGKTFVSSVGYKNVIGVQFHPEKSQKNGLKILENFVSWKFDA